MAKSAGRQGSNEHQEHSFKRIEKDIKNGMLPGVILLTGNENYLIRWSIEQIKRKYADPATEPFDFSRVDAGISTADEIINCCETFPLKSEKKVVVVSNLKMTGGADNPEMDEERLTAFFGQVPETCILVLEGEKPDTRKKAYKIIDKAHGAYDFSKLDSKSLTSFIKKLLKKAGKPVADDVIPAIIELSGYFDKSTEYTLDNLVNDVTKIISYSNTEIYAGDVYETLSGNIERDTFVFVDALCAERKKDAYAMMNNILSFGGNELQLLGAVCSQFEIIVSVKEMREEGYSYPEMVDALKIHEFRIKKASGFAQRYTVQRLKKILMQAYEVEKNFKTGLFDARLALEMFVAAA